MTTQTYPVVVFEDRYDGIYSGGRWVAVANADELIGGISRAQRFLESDAYGEDVAASEFWQTPPDWLAVASSADDAIRNLVRMRA